MKINSAHFPFDIVVHTQFTYKMIENNLKFQRWQSLLFCLSSHIEIYIVSMLPLCNTIYICQKCLWFPISFVQWIIPKRRDGYNGYSIYKRDCWWLPSAITNTKWTLLFRADQLLAIIGAIYLESNCYRELNAHARLLLYTFKSNENSLKLHDCDMVVVLGHFYV